MFRRGGRDDDDGLDDIDRQTMSREDQEFERRRAERRRAKRGGRKASDSDDDSDDARDRYQYGLNARPEGQPAPKKSSAATAAASWRGPPVPPLVEPHSWRPPSPQSALPNGLPRTGVIGYDYHVPPRTSSQRPSVAPNFGNAIGSNNNSTTNGNGYASYGKGVNTPMSNTSSSAPFEARVGNGGNSGSGRTTPVPTSVSPPPVFSPTHAHSIHAPPLKVSSSSSPSPSSNGMSPSAAESSSLPVARTGRDPHHAYTHPRRENNVVSPVTVLEESDDDEETLQAKTEAKYAAMNGGGGSSHSNGHGNDRPVWRGRSSSYSQHSQNSQHSGGGNGGKNGNDRDDDDGFDQKLSADRSGRAVNGNNDVIIPTTTTTGVVAAKSTTVTPIAATVITSSVPVSHLTVTVPPSTKSTVSSPPNQVSSPVTAAAATTTAASSSTSNKGTSSKKSTSTKSSKSSSTKSSSKKKKSSSSKKKKSKKKSGDSSDDDGTDSDDDKSMAPSPKAKKSSSTKSSTTSSATPRAPSSSTATKSTKSSSVVTPTSVGAASPATSPPLSSASSLSAEALAAWAMDMSASVMSQSWWQGSLGRSQQLQPPANKPSSSSSPAAATATTINGGASIDPAFAPRSEASILAAPHPTAVPKVPAGHGQGYDGGWRIRIMGMTGVFAAKPYIQLGTLTLNGTPNASPACNWQLVKTSPPLRARAATGDGIPIWQTHLSCRSRDVLLALVYDAIDGGVDSGPGIFMGEWSLGSGGLRTDVLERRTLALFDRGDYVSASVDAPLNAQRDSRPGEMIIECEWMSVIRYGHYSTEQEEEEAEQKKMEEERAAKAAVAAEQEAARRAQAHAHTEELRKKLERQKQAHAATTAALPSSFATPLPPPAVPTTPLTLPNAAAAAVTTTDDIPGEPSSPNPSVTPPPPVISSSYGVPPNLHLDGPTVSTGRINVSSSTLPPKKPTVRSKTPVRPRVDATTATTAVAGVTSLIDTPPPSPHPAMRPPEPKKPVSDSRRVARVQVWAEKQAAVAAANGTDGNRPPSPTPSALTDTDLEQVMAAAIHAEKHGIPSVRKSSASSSTTRPHQHRSSRKDRAPPADSIDNNGCAAIWLPRACVAGWPAAAGNTILASRPPLLPHEVAVATGRKSTATTGATAAKSAQRSKLQHIQRDTRGNAIKSKSGTIAAAPRAKRPVAAKSVAKSATTAAAAAASSDSKRAPSTEDTPGAAIDKVENDDESSHAPVVPAEPAVPLSAAPPSTNATPFFDEVEPDELDEEELVADVMAATAPATSSSSLVPPPLPASPPPPLPSTTTTIHREPSPSVPAVIVAGNTVVTTQHDGHLSYSDPTDGGWLVARDHPSSSQPPPPTIYNRRHSGDDGAIMDDDMNGPPEDSGTLTASHLQPEDHEAVFGGLEDDGEGFGDHEYEEHSHGGRSASSSIGGSGSGAGHSSDNDAPTPSVSALDGHDGRSNAATNSGSSGGGGSNTSVSITNKNAIIDPLINTGGNGSGLIVINANGDVVSGGESKSPRPMTSVTEPVRPLPDRYSIVRDLPQTKPEHLKCVEELRVQVAKFLPNHRADDYDLWRFSRACVWKLNESLRMYASYIEWRDREGVDTILESPPEPLIRHIQSWLPAAFHKSDRHHRPILYMRFGDRSASAMMENVSIPMFMKAHIWHIECQIQRMQQISESIGTWVRYMDVILDLQGFGKLSCYKFREYFRAMIASDQQYYPEYLGTLMFINAPWGFSSILSMVKAMIDPESAAKIETYSGGQEQIDGMLRLIHASDLPKEYGGTCDCVGGCIPRATAKES